MRFVAFQSIESDRPVRSLVPHSRHVLVVSDGKSGFYRPPWPAHFRKRAHPLISFDASPECYRLTSAPRLPAWSAFHGVAVPLRDISPQRPCNGVPRPSRSVLGVSHALDGFLRRWPCGSISPHSHVQGSLFRGLLPSHSRASSSPAVALSSLDGNALPIVAHRLHALSSRPQGVAPCEDPLPAPRCLAAAPARSPPELFLLQVLPLVVVRAPSRPRPLMVLAKSPSSRTLR